MPRPLAAAKPQTVALRQIIERRRNSFVIESEIRTLASFHDSRQRPTAPITVSRGDWELLAQGRSHFVHLGYVGAHRLVINGATS